MFDPWNCQNCKFIQNFQIYGNFINLRTGQYNLDSLIKKGLLWLHIMIQIICIVDMANGPNFVNCTL